MTKTEIIRNLNKNELIIIFKTLYTYKDIFDYLFFEFENKSYNKQLKTIFLLKLKEFDLDINNIIKRKNFSPIWSLSKNDFLKIVNSSSTMTEILDFFGMKNQGSNFKTIKRRFKADNINYEDFLNKSINRSSLKRRVHTNEILFSANSDIDRGTVRERILKDNLKIYECEICGQKPFWNGKPMTLVLDHINGVNNDHRLENLRFVCWHCNSQLDTTNGRNIKNTRKILPTTSEIDLKIIEIEEKNKLNQLSLKPIKKDIHKIKIKRFTQKEEKFCLSCDTKIDNRGKSGLCFTCLPRNREQKYSDIMEVYNMVIAVGYVKTGQHYGVSDKAVSQWLKKHNLNPLEKKNTENFINMALKLKEFITLNNTFPSYKETELWNWIQAVRGRYNTGTVKEDEIIILNNISERILKPESSEDMFEKGFQRLEDFIKKEKRTPRRSTKDKDEDLIAIFIKNQYARNNPERVERIKNLLSFYNL